MTLPRFRLPEENEDVDGDATAPAQFLLKLPESFARRLAPRPPPPLWTPSAPWTVEPDVILDVHVEKPSWLAERAWAVALVAAALFGIVLITGVSVAATPGHGPVGIAHRVPRALDNHVRVSTRHTGVAVPRPVAHTRHSPRTKAKSSSSHRRGT